MEEMDEATRRILVDLEGQIRSQGQTRSLIMEIMAKLEGVLARATALHEEMHTWRTRHEE